MASFDIEEQQTIIKAMLYIEQDTCPDNENAPECDREVFSMQVIGLQMAQFVLRE